MTALGCKKKKFIKFLQHTQTSGWVAHHRCLTLLISPLHFV